MHPGPAAQTFTIKVATIRVIAEESIRDQVLQYNKVGKGNPFQYVCQYRYAILVDMIRPLRIKFKGAVYHITSRGNDKQAIFLDEKDFLRISLASYLWWKKGSLHISISK